MKRKVLPLRTKRGVLLALAAMVAPALLWAQVSLYNYSESVETYTPITEADGGISLGVPTYWPPVYNQRAWVNTPFYDPDGQVCSYLNPAVGPGYPIGFNLTFNGDVFDRLSVSNSGFITLGKSSDGDQAVWTYAIDHPHGMPFVQSYGGPSVPYQRNRVAGWGTGSLYMQDMSSYDPPGPITSLRIATVGTAPNRVCVIQWKDFLMAYPPSSSRINFQIRLNEADNSVEVRYGVMTLSTSASPQVGLGGRTPEDFNSRMTVYEEPAFLYDMNITVPGVTNEDACYITAPAFGQPNGSGVPPDLGRNFKWTPAVCPPPAWPLAIGDISFDYASAQWEANGAGEYEYFVSTGDSITGPEASSGITTDPEAYFFGLEAATTYYVFVRSICAGEEGIWSLGTPFRTLGGGSVVCDGTVMTEDYCSHQNDVVSWLYVSDDGSPLKIEFLGGFIGNVTGGSFKIWNGGAPTGTPDLTLVGDITGQSFLASSGQIYIQLITDNGSCETQPWFLPLQWRVGCKNCTDPLVNFSLGTVDCDDQEYFVDVNVFSMGSSTTLSLENDLGLPPTVVSATGVHAVGPFPAGQSVVVTAQNPDNAMCYSASAALINDPCVTIGCGPTTYTYCYSDNEYRQWAYQGATGQEIGIRFIEGSLGLGDNGRVYNGLDILNLTPQNMPSGLANSFYTSGAPSTDRSLVMELIADNGMSCQDEDPLYGSSIPWKWVVACYDGCIQPKATFSSTCLSSTQFEVSVNITDIGSTGSVAITNDGGVAPVTATATGAYTVGPFPSGTAVTLNVEGADVLCTWTSPKQNPDCEGVGIVENSTQKLNVYPNPSEGRFFLSIPTGVSGSMDLQVQDITGRVVATQNMLTGASHEAVLELGHLPNGAYFVVLNTNSQRFIGRVQVVH